MFVAVSGDSSHQVRRSAFEFDLVRGGSTRPARAAFARTDVRSKPHPARGKERQASDDVVLRCIAVPTDRRAGGIFVDQRHGEVIRIAFSPRRESVADGKKKGGDRRCRCSSGIVRPSEECNSPPRNNPSHLELRKMDARDLACQICLFTRRDEISAIGETVRERWSKERHTRHVDSVWHVIVSAHIGVSKPASK